MRVEVLYFEGCPTYAPVLERVRSLLRQERIPAEVKAIEVRNEGDAKALGFSGSPTIRINSRDIEPDICDRTGGWLVCRRYAGGLPSDELILAALRQADEE